MSVNSNIVNASSQSTGIVASNVNGRVRGNEVINAVVGIFDEAPAVNLQGNIILAASGYGIYLVNGGTAVSNHVSGSNTGVFLGGGVSTVTGNRIESSLGPAVEMSCLSATLSQNFINDASVGIDQVPSSGIGPNTFANTATTTTSGCGSAALAVHVIGARSRAQWHTPATPFGTRIK